MHLVLALLGALRAALGARTDLVLENLALRQEQVGRGVDRRVLLTRHDGDAALRQRGVDALDRPLELGRAVAAEQQQRRDPQAGEPRRLEDVLLAPRASRAKWCGRRPRAPASWGATSAWRSRPQAVEHLLEEARDHTVAIAAVEQRLQAVDAARRMDLDAARDRRLVEHQFANDLPSVATRSPCGLEHTRRPRPPRLGRRARTPHAARAPVRGHSRVTRPRAPAGRRRRDGPVRPASSRRSAWGP